MYSGIRKHIFALLALAGLFLFTRYLLPLFLPFLLGAALAGAAEPLVSFLSSHLRLRRGLASGIGISAALSFLLMAVALVCGLVLRELRSLAGLLPELETTLRSGMSTLSAWLLNLAAATPEGLRGILTHNVNSFFSESSALLDKITGWALHFASGILSQVPNGALGLGTGIISSYMVSAKLPVIRNWLQTRLPLDRLRSGIAALEKIRTALGSWLKAQLKLSGITFFLALGGFLILRIPHSPLWALLVALVDAFPILGTGTVLVPWSLVSFLRGDRFLAFGLLGLYAAGAILRSVIEPKLLGKQLGLDPLVTLMALYVGFRLWGIPGMILSPLLAVLAIQLVTLPGAEDQFPS